MIPMQLIMMILLDAQLLVSLFAAVICHNIILLIYLFVSCLLAIDEIVLTAWSVLSLYQLLGCVCSNS